VSVILLKLRQAEILLPGMRMLLSPGSARRSCFLVELGHLKLLLFPVR